MGLFDDESGSCREFIQEFELYVHLYVHCLSFSLSQKGRAEPEAIDMDAATELWRAVRPERLCLGSTWLPGELKGYIHMSDEAPGKN